MEKWASGELGRQYKVQFICICVDSKDVAIEFANMFRFTYAKNAWISRRDLMPSYGQLGCSGFIVVGTDGKAISQKTKSFLDYGPEEAFMDVENMIFNSKYGLQGSSKLEKNTPRTENAYAPGCTVRIEGMKKNREINGSLGTIVKFDTTKGRYEVNLLGDRRILVTPCKLVPVESNLLQENVSNSATSVTIRHLECPPLIGCKEIDIEHEFCTKSLNALLDAVSVSSASGAHPELLHNVLTALEEHFEHEEKLAKKNGFGKGQTAGFSAFDSHLNDHNRILTKTRKAYAAAQSCGFVTTADAQDIANAFSKHATDFDVLLEGHLVA